MTEPGGSNQISGWLSKWTNIIGGYQKRWFVLSNGMLCYYKNPDEMAHACRGTISLAGATIDSDETCKFVISRNGYAYHVKADSQDDKQRWIEALTAARDAAPVDEQVSFVGHHWEPSDEQAASLIAAMKQKLKDVRACVDLMRKHGETLQNSVMAVESIDDDRLRDVSDNAAVFQSTASSLINACSDYLDLAESHGRQWLTLLKAEQEERIRMEKILHSLTQVQSGSLSRKSSEDEGSEYYDCSDTDLDGYGHLMRFPEVSMQVYQMANESVSPSGSPGSPPPPPPPPPSGSPLAPTTRRTRIPNRPNVSANLWSILKNCIGNDITKMPLPVAFAEPLSLLQRLTEDFEYANVLDRASECGSDVPKQMVYISAFIASAYSTTIGRCGKPFNPLLGETFECDRMSDLGWKSIAEQVSHHPPIAGLFCEGKTWEVWSEESMKTKFGGTTLHVLPQGVCHLKFSNGNQYTWKKPTTNIHNVIIGKLWVEQEGDVEIKCHSSDATCKLTFTAAGWFGDSYSIRGLVKDAAGKPVYDILGKYSTQIVYKPAGTKGSGTVIWTRTEPPQDSSKFYSFTLLSCQLNEMEPGVAPTDSRNRPDQRLMEEGKFDEANAMKKVLEDWQRANRKPSWTPAWFKQQRDPLTDTDIWTYGREYWTCKAKKDWSRCPAYIFRPG